MFCLYFKSNETIKNKLRYILCGLIMYSYNMFID